MRVSWAYHRDEDQELHILREKIEKDMIDEPRKAIMQINANKPAARWPDHWKDPVHGEDAGYDMFGRRTQDGRIILKQELSKLAFANGREWAQDDVSGVELDPELVKQAREVKMTFFRKMQVYTRVPPSDANKQRRKGFGVRWVDVNKGDSALSPLTITLFLSYPFPSLPLNTI